MHLHSVKGARTSYLYDCESVAYLLPTSNSKYDQLPSFRRTYAHLARSEAEGGKLEGTLAELRVQGGKRLGPARAKRLARVLMATRHEADALVL